MNKEISTLIHDKEFWKRAGISFVPGAATGFILNNRGDSDALLAGAYIWFLFVVLTVSWHVMTTRTTITSGFITSPDRDKPEERTTYQYPILRRVAILLSILIIIITFFLLFVPPFNARAESIVYGTPTPTATVTHSPTSTFTSTFTPTFTFTSTFSPTPTPKEQAYYYLIILDASAAMMNENFDGLPRWDAAQNSVNVILEVLDDRSNYGLILIGGSETPGANDPCISRSGEEVPFTSRGNLQSQIREIMPGGGGSYSAAFNLAVSKLQHLPSYTLKTLFFITGPSDACEKRDEWDDIEIASAAISSDLFSNIIILDEKSAYKPIQFAKRMQELHEKNIKVELPRNNLALERSSNKVIKQTITVITAHETAIAPTPLAPPRTFTPKPTNTPANTLTVFPTFTLTSTKTSTPSLTPPPPQVVLLSATYIDNGKPEGCDADIIFNVVGSSVTGNFHVWNASYPPEGDIYPEQTFPIENNQHRVVGLGGHGNPDYLAHKVWFEFNGTPSNYLVNLTCPRYLTPQP